MGGGILVRVQAPRGPAPGENRRPPKTLLSLAHELARPSTRTLPLSPSQMLAAFHDFGHYSHALFDDIGDAIAYANHYLAPVKADTALVGCREGQ